MGKLEHSDQVLRASLQSGDSKSFGVATKNIDLSEKDEILKNYRVAKSLYNNLDLSLDKPAVKRKRAKFIRKVKCQVCDDIANDHIHYGAIACYSCRAFFRRGVNSNANYYCSQDKNCSIKKHTRKHCQYCRFQKCISVGMKSSWVMTEEDKQEKKEKALLKKIKLKTIQLHRVSTKSKKAQYLYKQKKENNGTTTSSLRVPTLSQHIYPPQQDSSCLSKSPLSSHENPTQQCPIVSTASSSYSSINSSLSCSPIAISNTDGFSSTRHSPIAPVDTAPSYDPSISSTYTNLNTASSTSLHDPFCSGGDPPPSTQSKTTSGYASDMETNMSNSNKVPPSQSHSNKSFYDFFSTHRQKYPLYQLDPTLSSQSESQSNSSSSSCSGEPPQPANANKTFLKVLDEEKEDRKHVHNVTLRELLINSNFPIDLSQKSNSDICNYGVNPSEVLSKISTSNNEAVLPKKDMVISDLKNAGFSDYECNLISNIMNTESETSRLIPLSSETMATMINCSYSNKPFPQEVCLEGYLVCMRRIIRLASKLDFFTCFSMEDQKALLLANTDMIVNIRTARFFQPGVHLKKQVSFALGNSNTKDDSKSGRIEYLQIFQSPWACSYEHEKRYNELMKKIFDLQLDEVSTVLISMMSLFSSSNAKLHDELRANKTQEFFTNLMKRYITQHMGKDAACYLLPKCIFIISHLEEMAQIMVSKRLNI